ncbi:MAG: tRNA lysidine(34) synthetase TilS [Clostridiaceae bacterium]|nr:tRNA lysidine(34) synthetase TilS [Clostridiaceae bacterium]
MIQKVLNTIEKNSMFNKGDRVIVAVSGGPDSMSLLHLLNQLSKQLEISLIVAHVNHCLRGLEADKDQEFVHNFCEDFKIECYSKRIDINKIAKANNVSSETAGRDARYGYFIELKDKYKVNKIALAHNANDQAETVLMRIIRGTGLEGLVGIKPVREETYVRPLLNITRPEIEEYCVTNNINARLDKTNLENIYTRNKIRLELIPYLEKNFNQDIVNGLIKLGDIAKKDNDFIEKHVDFSYKKYCHRKQGKVIIKSEAFKEHESVLSRLIRRTFQEVNGNLYNFEKVHIYDIISIQKQGTGKVITLPSAVNAINEYGDIIITKEENSSEIEKYETFLHINEENRIQHIGMNITLKLLHSEKKINFTDKPNIRNFDFDKVTGDIIVRNRKDGDKFSPFGMKGTKKLKDLFIDLKVKKSERSKIPLICFGEDIAWIVGYRVSEKFKITSDTKNILQIKLESECSE